MKRAAVIIGVNRAGNLPVLNDAVAGAKEVAAWARSQSPRPRVILHLDERRPVTTAAIHRSIAALVAARNLDQLVVYFAGHGVNIGYSEYWLLTGAPVDTSAAVNVDASVVLARRCGIPHVVLISDACRTAADSVQAQLVTGSGVFPNDPVPGPEQAVDVFFATALGKPSLEVKDVNDAASRFQAVFTQCLVDALEGQHREVLDPQPAGSAAVGVIRPWPLKRFLMAAVPRRLAQLQPNLTITQQPDARITSQPEAWLSMVKLGDLPADPTPTRPGTGEQPHPPVDPTGPGAGESPGVGLGGATMLRAVTDELVDSALAGRSMGATVTATPEAAGLVAAARSGSARFGRRHFETTCGLKVRGTQLGQFQAGAAAFVERADADSLRVELGTSAAASVLVGLADGSAALVPAVAGMLTSLTFDSGELVDIAYEPSDNTARWADHADQFAASRKLRGVVAAAAQFATLPLDGPQAAQLIDGLARLAHLDPALAVIAAYAFHDRAEGGRIAELHDDLGTEFSVRIFDVAMLAGELTPVGEGLPAAANDDIGPAAGPDDADPHADGFEGSGLSASDLGVYPSLPMHTRSWPLLEAFRVALPEGLTDLRAHVLPGLWVKYDEAGSALIAEALSSGRIR